MMKRLTVAVMLMFLCSMSYGQVCVQAPQGIVAWWPGDQDSGDIAGDHSPTETLGTPEFVDAVVGQGMKFDGAMTGTPAIGEGYVIPDSPDINFGQAGSFTLDAWIRVDGESGPSAIWDAAIDKRVAGQKGYVLGYDHTCSCFHFAILSTGRQVDIRTDPVPFGEFHHLAVTVDRSSQIVSFYLDGAVQLGQKNIAHIEDTSNSGRLFIGHRTLDTPTALTAFNGVLDEVDVFDRALSGSEIQAIFDAGSAGKCRTPPLSCVSFEPPMASGPVTVKGNRALPFKAQLFDADGYLMTDSDLLAPPVIQIWYEYGTPEADDVSAEALPAGQSTEGNQFFFESDQRWHYNLKTGNYSASGTYTVFIDSGDSFEYLIDPACTAQFVVK